jgi:hypothetical protein
LTGRDWAVDEMAVDEMAVDQMMDKMNHGCGDEEMRDQDRSRAVSWTGAWPRSPRWAVFHISQASQI